MMLPVGKVEGMPFVVFCMATDDFVDDIHVKTPALSYCGAMQNDRKYPDPRGMGYPFNREWVQERVTGAKQQISEIIADHDTYPFMVTSTFKIYRTTKPFLDSVLNPPHFGTATWFDTIKGYFLPSDVVCMKAEYGYDLSNYEDVALHSPAILDAVRNKRIPLQMPPTQRKLRTRITPCGRTRCATTLRAGSPMGARWGKTRIPRRRRRPPGTTRSRTTSCRRTWRA